MAVACLKLNMAKYRRQIYRKTQKIIGSSYDCVDKIEPSPLRGEG